MDKKISYIFLGFVITACSSQERRILMSGGERVDGPTGYNDYVVSCFDISRCYSKASHECGGSYQIHNITEGVLDGGTRVQNMLITCERYSIYQKDSFFD